MAEKRKESFQDRRVFIHDAENCWCEGKWERQASNFHVLQVQQGCVVQACGCSLVDYGVFWGFLSRINKTVGNNSERKVVG